tara:strand:+ start:3989 stop:4711 length:723 start_codon:yes stop_codon:yes gene_type:complete
MLNGFLLNTILILIFRRLPVLTPSGWFHAGALGTILWGCLGSQAWFSVIIYLLLGSAVTKLGFKSKEIAGIAQSRGGARGPENVWGSAATGAIISILIKLNLGSYNLLIIGFAASFTAKLADTFGSEIGKRWGKKAFLITSFRPANVGTDGAISLEGTLASFGGSVIMASVMCLLSIISFDKVFIIVVASGFIATIAESVLGAIFQERIYWLTNEVLNAIQTLFSAILAIAFSGIWLSIY